MRAPLRTSAVLVCLAVAGGACRGDEEDDPQSDGSQRSAYTQPERNDSSPTEAAPNRAEEDREAPADADAPAAPETPTESDGSGARAEKAEPDREPKPGEDAAVRTAVRSFLDAMADKDAARACSKLSRDVRRLVGGTLGGNCARGMEFAFLVIAGNGGAFSKVRVTSVDVSGKRASARLRLPPELRTLPLLGLLAPGSRVALEREAGRWRLGLARGSG